jgi:hypothetical protein
MYNFIETYDNVLSSEQCEKIIKHHNTSARIRRGEIGDGIDLEKKNSWDVSGRFNLRTEVDTIVHRGLTKCLEKYKERNPELNQIGYWSLENDYNIQQYHPRGGYFASHCESCARSNSHRVLVWMIYLNTVTDGGGTKFPQYDLITDAVEGRVVLWPAGWTHFHHGVVSMTETKYIATGWYSFVPK